MATKRGRELWQDKTNVTFKSFKIERHEKEYYLGFRYRVGIVRKDGKRITNTQIGAYTHPKTAHGIAELLNRELQQSGNSVEWEFLPQPEIDEADPEPCDDPDEDDFDEFNEELFDSIGVNDEWTTDESGVIWKINDLESALLQQTQLLHEDEEP